MRGNSHVRCGTGEKTEITSKSYLSLLGIITNKAKFINQIMTSKDPVRVAEDVDETVLTYSQMQAIASGNPLIVEKIQLDNDICSLTRKIQKMQNRGKCRKKYKNAIKTA